MKKVVILSAYNTQIGLTYEFLDTILKFKNTGVKVELVLVNGGSDTKIEHSAISHRLDITEKGFAKVFNTGLQFIVDNLKFDYILMLGNDSFPLGDEWLGKLIELQLETGAFVTCPSTTRPPMKDYSHLLLQDNGHYWSVDMFPSIVYLLSRECVETIGFWDEGYTRTGMYGDNDYCKRVRSSGHSIVVSKDIVMEHRLSQESGSTGTIGKDMVVNGEYFRKKWGFK